MSIIGLIYTLFIYSSFAGILAWIMSWSLHVHMNKEEKLPYGWGNFRKFIEQFDKYNKWEIEKQRKGSFFSLSKDMIEYVKYYIHASVIKFDGKCMILDPISWLKFCVWRNKKWKEMGGKDPKLPKIKW